MHEFCLFKAHRQIFSIIFNTLGEEFLVWHKAKHTENLTMLGQTVLQTRMLRCFVYLCVHIYSKLIFQNSKYADLLESLKSHNGGLNVICYVICRLKASFSKVLSSFRMSGSCLVIKVCLLSKECLLSLIMLESLGK